MRIEAEDSQEDAWTLSWTSGVETLLLEFLYHLSLMSCVYLCWYRWPVVGDSSQIPLAKALAAVLVVALVISWFRYRQRGGRESLGLILSTNRLVLVRKARLRAFQLCSSLWSSPLCLVLVCRFLPTELPTELPPLSHLSKRVFAAWVIRRREQKASCRLIIWRHNVGEEAFRRLRRHLKNLA